MRERIRAIVERILPWYDPAAEACRDARLERRIAMSRAVRAKAVHTIHRSAIEGYRAYGRRVTR